MRWPRWLGARSFRGKIVLSTVGMITAAMIIVGVGIQLLLAYSANRDIERVLTERADAMISVIEQASGESLTVPPDAIEPGVQVFDADGNAIAGSVESDARDVAAELGSTTRVAVRDGPDEEERLLGVPFTTPSGDRGVIVVSQETAPYERAELYALIASGALAVVVIAATALIALRVTRQALEPVTQMADRATEWSEADLSHRFNLGAPDNELSALAETLDHLLDRVAQVILAEQRLTSELAHELRTPLTSIQGSADLALMRGVQDPLVRRDLEQISASARSMSVVISTLLDIAREGRSGLDATTTVDEVADELVASVPAGIEVVVSHPDDLPRIAAPQQIVVRALQPIVENAGQYAQNRISVETSLRDDRLWMAISDDGPGVDPEVRDHVFDAGVTRRTNGSGLGLGIAQRVVRSFGGEISLADTTDGATFLAELPHT